MNTSHNTVPFGPSASDLACDAEQAKAYVERRHVDARQFVSSIVWQSATADMFEFTIYSDLRANVRIVHDLQGSVLAGDTCWGELFTTNPDKTIDTERFYTFECFVAYWLAKYW
jgi:hypothetical protein